MTARPHHTHRLRLSRVFAAMSLVALPLVVSAQPPTPCTPRAQLTGRDTLLVILPCNSLDVLPVGMRTQVDCTLAKMKAGGFDAAVFETYRSDERQRFLYSYGRTRPGPRVTNVATAATGLHYWTLAVDVIDRRKHWDASPKFWHWLGQHAESCGLIAGAFWRSFPDQPHLQYAAWESASQRPAWAKRLQSEGKRDSLLLRLGAK